MSFRQRIPGIVRGLGLMRLTNALANTWFGAIKAFYRFRGRSYVEAIYSDRYFDAEEEMTQGSAQAVALSLVEELHPDSVADVGCGTAVYLEALEQRGIEVQGFEWSDAAIERARIDRGKIHRQDLRELLTAPKTYDLVLCFEVAEHLPAEFSERIVENICRLGATVAFSAAQPGQGGTDHINEQPPAYWIERFSRRGYPLQEDATKRLRTTLAAKDCVWWLPRNLLIFHGENPPPAQE